MICRTTCIPVRISRCLGRIIRRRWTCRARTLTRVGGICRTGACRLFCLGGATDIVSRIRTQARCLTGVWLVRTGRTFCTSLNTTAAVRICLGTAWAPITRGTCRTRCRTCRQIVPNRTRNVRYQTAPRCAGRCAIHTAICGITGCTRTCC